MNFEIHTACERRRDWLCVISLLVLVAALSLISYSRTVSGIDLAEQFDALRFEYENQESDAREVIHYQLLKPARIESGRRYPLVLFLHGSGDRGNDNRQQLDTFPSAMARPMWRRTYPCFVVAPQCADGRSWKEYQHSLLLLLDALEREHPVDRRRIYLTGFSMGGFGAWTVLSRDPERFAAVVPICGGGDISLADKLTRNQIWVVHGEEDRSVSVNASRDMVAAIADAGGHAFYTEISGIGHNSWSLVYNNPDAITAWMFRQVKRDREDR